MARSLSVLQIAASTPKFDRSASQNPRFPQLSLRCNRLVSSFAGNGLSVSFSSSKVSAPRSHHTVTAVLLSLPTANPEWTSPDKIPKWSARSIKAFAMGEVEARKIKYQNTGTEALLMGILVEGTNLAAKFLRANGITHMKVRDETLKLVGKADFFDKSLENPPLTVQALRALDWAVDAKLKSGKDGEITPTHLLLGIWEQEDSAGYKVLATLGFDDEKSKELEQIMDQDVVMSYNSNFCGF